MKPVKAKKHLGQHFLIDQTIAQNIVNGLESDFPLVEVGPGTGVLTKYLVEKKTKDKFSVSEIDRDSVAFLKEHFPSLTIIQESFLSLDLSTLFPAKKINIIGNFPYNISSQILFHALDYKEHVHELVGMLQKEVCERIVSNHSNKAYGILSVLIQAYYKAEYLFTVHENVFDPPPRVKSGVIRLTRNGVTDLGCDPIVFKKVVKHTFNQRRKMLRKTVKSLLTQEVKPDQIPFSTKRPENLSVQDFVKLTLFVESKV